MINCFLKLLLLNQEKEGFEPAFLFIDYVIIHKN